MRKLNLSLLIFAVLIIMAFTSCEESGSGDDSPYIIKFKINSTPYEFTSGYNDLSAEPEGNDYNGTSSYFAAVPSGAANNDDVFVMIRVNGTTTGSYDDSGDINDLNFDYRFNGNKWDDHEAAAADFSMTITKYEPVGGVIEGTFEGPVINDDTLETAVLTDGYFYVERIADGTLTAPW